MTPERKAQLQTCMDKVIEREIKYAIPNMGAAEMAQHLSDLAQIHTCISTAFDLLSGQAYKALGDVLINAATRPSAPDRER